MRRVRKVDGRGDRYRGSLVHRRGRRETDRSASDVPDGSSLELIVHLYTPRQERTRSRLGYRARRRRPAGRPAGETTHVRR